MPQAWDIQVENAYGEIKPIEIEDPRQVGRAIHQILRSYILQGVLQPGTVLNQVSLAQRLNVSRTPIREVIRMLKEEGLVTADLNQRALVAGISYDDLDALYSVRITNEALALAVSIHRNTEQDKKRIKSAADVINSSNINDFPTWSKHHRDFHLALYESAGESMLQLIRPNMEKCERFQAIRWRKLPSSGFRKGEDEHLAIVEACLARETINAVELLSTHLARTALDTLNDLAPEREPQFIRQALRCVTTGVQGISVK